MCPSARSTGDFSVGILGADQTRHFRKIAPCAAEALCAGFPGLLAPLIPRGSAGSAWAPARPAPPLRFVRWAPRFWEGRADMVAAAAPSSALACRVLLAATRRARPERPPQGSDGVELRHRGFYGRLEVGGGREREEDRRGRASASGRQGTLCPGSLTALPSSPERVTSDWGGGFWALCAAGSRGARAGTGAAGPDGVNGRARPVPRGAAAATALAAGPGVLRGRSLPF
nr:collagen alpha-2(I) chain-like [Aotus nancymaae]